MAEEKKLCMNCFSEQDLPNGMCPVCGWDNSKPQISEGIPYGTVLNARYEIGRAKAMNGEGITYAAYDIISKKTVDLREFYPSSIAKRDEDGIVTAIDSKESLYDRYLDAFIELSKNVSRLKEITVVSSIVDIFEENYTAYAVYEFVPSITLKRYIQNNGVMTWNQANNLFTPVLTALGLINSLGMSHLGISPETLRVTTEGNLLITSFCIEDARIVDTPIIEELYDGFAAVEQYDPDGNLGEITDVYAFTAVFVYAISGVVLPAAPQRLKDERLLIPAEHLRKLPSFAVSGIANALQVKQESRTTSFERLRSELKSAPTVRSTMSQTTAIRRLPSMQSERASHRGLPPFVWLIVTCAVTLVALFIVASMWLKDSGMSFDVIFDVFKGESSSVSVSDVPNMLNESLEQWEEKIQNGEYDFTITVSSRNFSDTVEEGYIISQTPNYGEPMPADKTISVVVSRGSEERTLPEIKGLSFVDLSTLLTDNGFIVQKEEEASEDIALGSVIRYKDNAEGDTLEYGSTIILVVSTGPEEQ